MDEVLRYLNERVGEEAAVIQSFSLYIKGGEVRVDLRDHGPGTGPLRYSAEAYDPEVPRTEWRANSNGHSIGNPGPTVTEALENVHWNVFGGRE